MAPTDISIILHQTLEILWTIAITRGHNNIESSINIVVKVIQMDDKLFKRMKYCSIGWRVVKLDEYTHYNLEPTVFEVFGIVDS
jgi:hypothetical protein